MISQSEATGLLQKIRNVTDVGEETFPRIFLAHNLRIQLSCCMFFSNNSNNKKSILLTAKSESSLPNRSHAFTWL